MKYFEPTKEEKEIEKAFNQGKLIRVKDFAKEKREAILAAKYTLGKIKNINLRVTAKTLYKLKAKATEEGVPYQTLASSILHKYASQ